MNNNLLAFFLTIIAGSSTLISLIFLFFKNKNNNIIVNSLSFAAGVMITISLVELIPEALHLMKDTFYSIPAILIILIFMTIGIIISMTIDKYIPTIDDNNLYKVGLISMLGIIIHNIPEGIATFIGTNSDLKLGVTLTIAIALHNIPEGISIVVPIYYATKDKRKAFKYVFISALSEPFGALLAYIFISPFITNNIMAIILAITAGIMLHISFYELIPGALKYKNKKRVITYFIIGVLFFLITNSFLN